MKTYAIVASILVCSGLYFEYCVSREIESTLQFSATVAYLAFLFFSIKYVFKQLIKKIK